MRTTWQVCSLAIVVGCCAATALAGAEIEAAGEVRLEVGGEPSPFGMAVQAVELVSDGAQLQISVEVGQDVVEFLKGDYAQGLVQVMIDADDDAATGGAPFGSDEGGFDFAVSIYACKEFDNGRVCAGDVGDGVPVSAYTAQFEPEKWDPDSERFEDVHDLMWEDGGGVIEGSTVQAQVTYEDIGLESGGVARIVILGESGRALEVPSARLTVR